MKMDRQIGNSSNETIFQVPANLSFFPDERLSSAKTDASFILVEPLWLEGATGWQMVIMNS